MTMKIALDTNAYSDFMRGEPNRVQILRAAGLIFLPLIVLGELRAGFIPTNDLWIAALVVQHNLVLCTSDAHFQQLPQIPKC